MTPFGWVFYSMCALILYLTVSYLCLLVSARIYDLDTTNNNRNMGVFERYKWEDASGEAMFWPFYMFVWMYRGLRNMIIKITVNTR